MLQTKIATGSWRWSYSRANAADNIQIWSYCIKLTRNWTCFLWQSHLTWYLLEFMCFVNKEIRSSTILEQKTFYYLLRYKGHRGLTTVILLLYIHFCYKICIHCSISAVFVLTRPIGDLSTCYISYSNYRSQCTKHRWICRDLPRFAITTSGTMKERQITL